MCFLLFLFFCVRCALSVVRCAPHHSKTCLCLPYVFLCHTHVHTRAPTTCITHKLLDAFVNNRPNLSSPFRVTATPRRSSPRAHQITASATRPLWFCLEGAASCSRPGKHTSPPWMIRGCFMAVVRRARSGMWTNSRGVTGAIRAPRGRTKAPTLWERLQPYARAARTARRQSSSVRQT